MDHSDQRYRSPQRKSHDKYQSSTTDRLTSAGVTNDRISQLEETVKMLKDCLIRHGIDGDKECEQAKLKKNIKNESIEEWNLQKRNHYLQEKVSRLKRQRERQSQHIKAIKNSYDWQKRNKCLDQCYQSRYIKLLRMRCPSTSY